MSSVLLLIICLNLPLTGCNWEPYKIEVKEVQIEDENIKDTMTSKLGTIDEGDIVSEDGTNFDRFNRKYTTKEIIKEQCKP